MERSREGCEDQMAFGSYAVDLRVSKKATHTHTHTYNSSTQVAEAGGAQKI